LVGIGFALALFAHPASASSVVFDLYNNGSLAGFNAAAGNPPISIDFDGISPGTDIGGATISGVTFTQTGSPLIVVRAADTYTPPAGYVGIIDASTNVLPATSGQNVLSPGGIVLGPGPDPAIESDSLTLTFTSALSAFGFDHLSQSADGASYTSITVFDSNNNVMYSGIIPISNVGGIGGGAPAAADFWGIVSTGADIKQIVITETDNNNVFPDCNIGFDTFRFGATAVPLPPAAAMALPVLGMIAWFRRRRSV